MTSFLTDPFINLELQKNSNDVSKQNKIRRSPDFEALKWHGRVALISPDFYSVFFFLLLSFQWKPGEQLLLLLKLLLLICDSWLHGWAFEWIDWRRVWNVIDLSGNWTSFWLSRVLLGFFKKWVKPIKNVSNWFSPPPLPPRGETFFYLFLFSFHSKKHSLSNSLLAPLFHSFLFGQWKKSQLFWKSLPVSFFSFSVRSLDQLISWFVFWTSKQANLVSLFIVIAINTGKFTQAAPSVCFDCALSQNFNLGKIKSVRKEHVPLQGTIAIGIIRSS